MEPGVHAVPTDGRHGFLQRWDTDRGRFLTSPELHQGPWAVCTVLLDPTRHARFRPMRDTPHG